MTLVYLSWLALLAVLLVGAVMVVRAIRDFNRLPRYIDNPLLRIKDRYDRGEITRAEFEAQLTQELERSRDRRAA